MPITGSQKAPLYAQFGTMRFGATRFGYTSPKVFVKVGGVQRGNAGTDILQALSITETNNSTPNKASFNAMHTWEPTYGMPVEVTMGSINRIRKLFAGTVLNVTETNSGVLRKFAVDCVDWSWKLDNGPAVYGYYTGTYDAIARELMSDYGPTDFTVRQVETGLATCTGGITFTGVKLSKALDRLQKRARGEGINITKFIDYNKDLYFRQTQSIDWTSPHTVTASADSLKKLDVRRDMSQIANRVPFIGGGANALTETAAGETILPLTDAPDYWYGDVGGVVVSGPQQITYTARVAGGGGSVVGPGVSPSNAPTAALAAGAGVDSGSHVISFVWKTASGRTLPGATTTIVVGLVSAPVATPIAGTVQAGTGPDDGVHLFAISHVTASGETPPGPTVSATTSSRAVSAPSAAWSIAVAGAGTGTSAWAIGDSVYFKATYLISGGETLPGPQTSTTTAISDPLNPTLAEKFSVVAIASGDSAVTGIRFYANVNGSYIGYQDFPNASASCIPFSFTAGSPPGASTATIKTQQVPLSNLEVSPALGTSRKVWGTVAGGSTLKFIASINTTDTTYLVTTPDASLGATAPSSNTATANQIALSGIAVGPSGTTERDVYMSPVGGGTRRLALNIANNTATTGTITMSDATLAGQAAEPSSDTSGLTQPSGQVLPGATSMVVAGTAPFQSGGGWAFTGTQQIRYTGFSGASLTGIPSSGAGAITQPINYNTTIAAAPCLTGIPASGAGAILYTIPKGDPVNLYVTVEDTVAQADLAARLDDGSDGVRECSPLSDNRLKRTEAITRASAFLALRAYPSTSISRLTSKDMNCRAGLDVVVSVTAPHNISGTFQIQSVTINNFTQALAPDYTFQAADELFSVEDILSRDS